MAKLTKRQRVLLLSRKKANAAQIVARFFLLFGTFFLAIIFFGIMGFLFWFIFAIIIYPSKLGKEQEEIDFRLAGR